MAVFSHMSHEQFNDLQFALLAIDEKQATCKSPHDWLVMLFTDLATFCSLGALLGLNWGHSEVQFLDTLLAQG